MKRRLHLLHRWLGIGLCAVFTAWFGSGFFMMYVEYPQLTRPERLAAAPPLDFSGARLSPAEAAGRLRAGDFARRGTPTRNVPVPVADPAAAIQPESLRLAMILGRPAYVFTAGTAQPVVRFADTGERLPPVSAVDATAAVRAFRPGATPRFVATVQSDQWAVSSALNPHRPLHHFAFDDAAGTEVYVSSTTGEVVRDSTRRERVLNYFGAVIHYLYPHVLRQFPDAWAWVVDTVAATGCVLAVSGLGVGLLRARRRVPAARSSQQRLIRWHYAAGTVFGGVTLTWVFSGWMSMNPGQINPSRTPTPAERAVLAGGPFSLADFARPAFDGEIVEAEAVRYAGRPYWRIAARDGVTRLQPAGGGAAEPGPEAAALIAAASRLRHDATMADARVLTAYDDDYYTRHPEDGGRPLPVVRVKFNDADATWFHLDVTTGQIVDRSTRTNRVFRWLYNGLHSFDWWWLWSRRPLWDVVVITFCSGGLALSVLGVVLGVRRVLGEGAR